MDDNRKSHLQALVDQRFKYISPEDARRAHEKGFPFGIAVQTETSEEREFVEFRAKAALDAKLEAKALREKLQPPERHGKRKRFVDQPKQPSLTRTPKHRDKSTLEKKDRTGPSLARRRKP